MQEAIHVRVLGAGPPVLLVHGGVGPGITWELQEPLAARWKLVIPALRGYPPSPPAERQDFEVDALDIEGLLEHERAHAVGFSYGGLGVAVAAARAPERLRSLTLIEVPLFAFAPDEPEVRDLIGLADAYVSETGPRRPERDEAFERLAGVHAPATPEVEAELERVRRLARGLHRPQEARPPLDAIPAAGIPTLVLSGDHNAGLELLCDAVAARLGGRRERIPGAGHAVPRAPGFNERLEQFLRESEAATGSPRA